ncbi:MAG: hypothetical protein JRH11_21435 [Deltaproteobacteria bacterium]|nr:hypothetical protein [Deltaproteobacteria bacterium]
MKSWSAMGMREWDGGASLCSQGETWFAVQVVGLVSLGAGLASGLLFLLLDDDDEEDADAVNDVAIVPSFSTEGGFLTAVGTF